jgi:enoyl-CoA hydratase
MSTGPLTVDVVDRVATVTLDRPEKRNALDGELLQAIPDALKALDADDDVAVVILTGRDPAFCAGLDLGALAEGGLGFRPELGQRGPFPVMSTPIIGAVNGPAVTGGFELALNCDLLVASDRARFADTHARVGVMPDWGLSVLLPQAIGVRRARFMSFTGNYVDAPTALDWGLVAEVVPHDELLPRCRAIAADIAGNDAAAVQFLKQTYAEVTAGDISEGWEIEHRRAAEWMQGFGDRLATLADRQAAIKDRGSSQVSE